MVYGKHLKKKILHLKECMLNISPKFYILNLGFVIVQYQHF